MFCCFLFFCNINLALSRENFTYSVSVHPTCSLFDGRYKKFTILAHLDLAAFLHKKIYFIFKFLKCISCQIKYMEGTIDRPYFPSCCAPVCNINTVFSNRVQLAQIFLSCLVLSDSELIPKLRILSHVARLLARKASLLLGLHLHKKQ